MLQISEEAHAELKKYCVADNKTMSKVVASMIHNAINPPLVNVLKVIKK